MPASRHPRPKTMERACDPKVSQKPPLAYERRSEWAPFTRSSGTFVPGDQSQTIQSPECWARAQIFRRRLNSLSYPIRRVCVDRTFQTMHARWHAFTVAIFLRLRLPDVGSECSSSIAGTTHSQESSTRLVSKAIPCWDAAECRRSFHRPPRFLCGRFRYLWCLAVGGHGGGIIGGHYHQARFDKLSLVDQWRGAKQARCAAIHFSFASVMRPFCGRRTFNKPVCGH